jgi:transcriptional regulator with XRE-family HTH domain
MDIAAWISELRLRSDLSQRELARRAGTSQPAIARLERGEGSVTVATLARLARAAGFELRIDVVGSSSPDPVIERYKRDVDRTLLRENLRKTVDERIRALGEQQRFAREVRQATRRAKRSS